MDKLAEKNKLLVKSHFYELCETTESKCDCRQKEKSNVCSQADINTFALFVSVIWW